METPPAGHPAQFSALCSTPERPVHLTFSLTLPYYSQHQLAMADVKGA
jgi:hypothetical protein